MGKDRRKKENRKQTTVSVTNDVDSEPKTQREPKVRAPLEQKEKDGNKAADSSVKDKTPDRTLDKKQNSETEPPDPAVLFANLKRETDDIEALKVKNIPHRQIASNWSRYDEPLPCPKYEVEIQGADFETLLQAPEGGYFQFKSERAWDANASAFSGELFSLDADLLAQGLATIPLYKKLDLPTSILSVTEIEELDHYAKQNVSKFESIKNSSTRQQYKKTVSNLIDNLSMKESSPVPDDTVKKSVQLSFDIAQPDLQNEETEPISISGSSFNAEADKKQDLVTNIEPVHNKTTPHQRIAISKPLLPEVTARGDSKVKDDNLSTEAIIREPKAELVHSPEDVKENSTKQITEKPEPEQNAVKVVEPAVPLGQRSSRRKARAQNNQKTDSQKLQKTDDESEFQDQPAEIQNSNIQKFQQNDKQNNSDTSEHRKHQQTDIKPAKEADVSKIQKMDAKRSQQAHSNRRDHAQNADVCNVENQKLKQRTETQTAELRKFDSKKSPQADDDLDFLLSLKKPIRESQMSALQPSQVSKPTIEDDDTSASNSSQFPLMAPQKQSEDLEDWLDSMLDD